MGATVAADTTDAVTRTGCLADVDPPALDPSCHRRH
jgi:hypothetical protein